MAQPRTAQNGQIQRTNNNPPQKDLVSLLRAMTPDLERALPKHLSADRMMRIALTALRTNEKLGQCTQGSFLGAVISAAQLGLEVNTPLGQAYLIPYKGECTLQLGYQGMMDLARRSGMVSAIRAHDVRIGDKFSYQLGLNLVLEHIPSEDPDRESKTLTHVYAVAKLKDGEPVITVLTKAQVDKFRKRSMAASSGPWVTDYTAMALKTAIRRIFTWLPKSAEMARAAALDESPEIGKAQADAWDPSVTEALKSQGVEVPTTGEESPPTHDPETGEVPPDQEPPEPGSNG